MVPYPDPVAAFGPDPCFCSLRSPAEKLEDLCDCGMMYKIWEDEGRCVRWPGCPG
ncbi:unnamed protein product [Linum tenue]|uniref:Uncharacterized protein n=1 Tax=Linum tenue TaxID=586396 RepID=A0AAV0PRP1_9ROSI|nr:unnamed protein product [Linum tenue]